MRNYEDEEKNIGKLESGQKNSQVLKPKEMKAIKVNLTTPQINNYRIQGNTISLQREIGGFYKWQLVILDVVIETVLTFKVHIQETMKRQLCIGVTDKITQKERRQVQNPHSIYFYGWSGHIYYGNGEPGKEKEQREETGICLNSGMDVLVEVDKINCRVIFDIQKLQFGKPKGGVRKFQVRSPILSQPNRQFVPFIQMQDKGDTISWKIK